MRIFSQSGETLKPQKVCNKSLDRFFALTCGEKGRGRKLVYVPLSKEIQQDIRLRGSFELTGDYKIAKTEKDNWLIQPVSDKNKKKGIIVVTTWDTDRGYINSNISQLQEDKKITIIATGKSAKGEAGRAASYTQYILHVKETCKIEYKKTRKTKKGKTEEKTFVCEINVEDQTVVEYPVL